jgi:hypothetical protein
MRDVGVPNGTKIVPNGTLEEADADAAQSMEDIMRNLISVAKDGTYEIKIPIPGRPVSHVLPHRFSTEERAYDWLQSPEGVSTVTRVREKYKKLNAARPRRQCSIRLGQAFR